MAEFTRICAQSELPKPGEVREFTAKNRALCVANVGGAIRDAALPSGVATDGADISAAATPAA